MQQTNQANGPGQNGPQGAFSAFSDELIALIKGLGGTYTQGVKAQAIAQLLREFVNRAVDPKVLGPAMQMGVVAAEGFMRGRQYNTRTALEPAAQVLRAVEAIQLAALDVRSKTGDPLHKTPVAWFRPGVFWGSQKLTLYGQIRRLENTLQVADEQCDYAGSLILQRFNPLQVFAPNAMNSRTSTLSTRQATQVATETPRPESPFPVPLAGYRRLQDQVIAVRAFVAEFASVLYTTAGESAALINASRTADGTGVNPVTVRSEGQSLMKMVCAGLLTCRALESVLDQPLATRSARKQRESEHASTRAPARDTARSRDEAQPTMPAA